MRPRDRLLQAVSRKGPPIPPRRQDEPAPLSWAQERFRILEELVPGTTAWHITNRFWLRGAVDVASLEHALRDMHARHDILRTRMIARDGGVHQEPSNHEVDLQLVDLRGLEPADRDARIEALERSLARPFDLDHDTLWRSALARVGDRELFLILRFHHVVTDASSTGIFIRELAELYTARSTGRASTLKPPARQYADYAAWQRSPMLADEHARQLGYWTAQLREAQPVELPTDRRYPDERSHPAGHVTFAMPPALVEALRVVSEREEATLFIGLLTVFKLLLARYGGTHDVALATPVVDARDRDTRGIIGPFLNTIVVRTDLGGVDDFSAALRRVRDVVIGGLEHKDVPLEHVLGALRTSRGGAAPQLNVMFSMPPPRTLMPLGDIELEYVTKPAMHTEFDLELVFTGPKLDGRIIYDTELFEHTKIERMARHFLRLVAQVVDESVRALPSLELLDDDERAQLRSWNETARSVEGPQTIHARVAQQAARCPDKVAVVCQGVELSYRELAARIERVAGWLATRGVSRGDRVVVGVERSVDMVVAALAVLRVGAAYVPIDPEYPAQRRELMRMDAGAVVELTDVTLGEALACTASAPPVEVAGEDVAYILYTSGSTGTPKGVRVPHRAVVNFLTSMQKAPGLASTDTLLAVTTLSFDIAGLELYLPLVTGARVVIASSDEARDGHRLAALLASSGATVMQATPATWRMLLAADWRPAPTLRILCGGEALPHDLAATLSATAGALWNLYGPTETTIWSTCANIAPGSAITLGRPIDNTTLHVLDEARQLVPIGVPGELYIGGVGVALGYHARPELTAERFVVDPFAAEPGARMYRTGDRVVWRSDGTLAYLGRVDTQIKLRGFRIELGEIEATLRVSGLVADAAVLVRERIPGHPLLVAYVVTLGALDVPALRAAIRAALPEYMVPGVFVALPALPLTPNGKVDRKALPAPALGSEAFDVAPPRDATQERIAQIWKELLGVERVGLHDDFFGLGGNSLLAIRLVAQMERAFGVRVSLRNVFRHPRLEDLAADIGSMQRPSSGTSRPTLEPTGRKRGRLLAPQRGAYLIDRWAPDNAANRMTYSMWLDGRLDVAPLESALLAMRDRHTVLRSRYITEGGEHRQEVLDTIDLPMLHRADVSGLSEDQREAEDGAALDGFLRSPFALERGEVVRALLVRWSPNRHRLTICFHHAVSDPQTLQIFDHELSVLWRAFVADPETAASALPPPGVQCLDLVDYLERLAASSLGEQQRAYWTSQLAGATPITLPSDRPRAPVDALRRAHDGYVAFPSASVITKLDADDTAALERLAGDTDGSVLSVLLAVLCTQLSEATGQDDLAIVSHLLFRHIPGLERALGFYSNALVLRVSTAGSPTLRDLIGRTHEQVTSTFEHGEFDVLSVAGNLFRVLFNYHYTASVLPTSDAPAPPPGLTRAPAPLTGRATIAYPYDLAVNVDAYPDRIRLQINYNLELFEASTAERFVATYVEAVRRACTPWRAGVADQAARGDIGPRA